MTLNIQLIKLLTRSHDPKWKKKKKKERNFMWSKLNLFASHTEHFGFNLGYE